MTEILNKYWLFLVFICFLGCTPVLKEIEDEGSDGKVAIKRVVLDRDNGLLNVYVSIPGDFPFNIETADFYERIDRKRCSFRWEGFDKTDEIKGESIDTFSILFLLDYSGSMRDYDRMVKAKEAIKATIQEIKLPPSSTIDLAVFNDTISGNQRLTRDNVNEIVDPIIVPPKGGGKRTDLYRAIIWKAREMANMPGKKVLVLLSDGENDIKYNPYYLNNPKFEPSDARDAIEHIDTTHDFMFFPIGLGNKTDSLFLKELVDVTQTDEDEFIYSEDADQLAGIVIGVLQTFSSDYRIQLIPSCKNYKGEIRTLMMHLMSPEVDTVVRRNYVEATAFGTTNLDIDESKITYWLILMLIGVLILGFLLLILMYMVPFFKRQEFKKRFVVKYVPEPHKIKRDPITQDAFEEGDHVVIKCRQMTSLATWEALGHCPNYPSCMEFNDPCPGTGGEEISGSFFSQQGIFRILNWLWYGAVGGFLGWLSFALTRYDSPDWMRNFLFKIFTEENMYNKLVSIEGGKVLIDNVELFVDHFLYGMYTGTFLILALTFAEEIGQTRKFSYKRMLLRGVIGLMASFIIFFSGGILQALVFRDPLITELVTWPIFGIVLGSVLSINSSISFTRGVLSSLAAVIVAYGIYMGIFYLVEENDGLQRLLCNLALGAVLGVLVVTIIAQLEDFELVYISPSEYSGMVKPISKWLKKGMEIFIGTSSKCYVFIKWDDEFAEDKHAKLIYYGGQVFIIPLHETLVNGVIVPENQKTPLQNNDIIQLGRYSNSKMQYKEKRSNVKS